jgi:molybdenum cofactor cytidylyltransferase
MPTTDKGMPTTETAGAPPFVSGIVLAAGTSSRLGRPKQLLPVGDRCLLRCVVDAALASRLDEVVVVLGHRADDVRAALACESEPRVSLVVNPSYSAGQSTSLRCGLRAADGRAQAAAILLGDQREVGPELIDTLVAAFLASDLPGARPVYPEAAGAPGHPVLIARELWPEVEAQQGDVGARGLFADHPDWLLTVPVAGPPPTDVDTPGDTRRLGV